MATHAAPLPRADVKRLDGWLKARARQVRLPLACAIGLGGLGGLLLVLQSWLLASIVNGAVFRALPLAGLWPWFLGLLAVFAARAGASFLSEAAATAAALRAKRSLRSALHEKLAALGPRHAARAHSGEQSMLLTGGLDKLDQYYAAYLPQSALAAFIPLAILVFVFPTDWVSGLIMLISAPLIPIFMIVIGKGTEYLNQRQWRRLALLSTHFFDVIEGLTTLKLFTISRLEGKIVGSIADDYRQSVMAVLRVAFLSALVLEFFATISIAMVAVYIGFRLYYGQMHFLPGFYVLLLAPEFYRPLRSMGTQYHARMEAVAAAEQIVDFLQTPETETQPAPQAGSDAAMPAQPRPLAAPVLQIRVRDVAFDYDAAAPVLAGINLELERGRLVALVGSSGGGKSTLARLLLGLDTPSAGQITVDGRDLRSIAPADWFRHVAWMPQNPTLLRGTIAENIRLGVRDAEMAEVRHAAQMAHAAGFIEAFPQGYETMLGDHGQGLSGGQIRRIALARAILKPADLVVLDEPDASLDAEAAALIGTTIAQLAQERAVLMIAHRLESVARADTIAVLEHGRIVEAGTHAALLARGGAYAASVALYSEAR